MLRSSGRDSKPFGSGESLETIKDGVTFVGICGLWVFGRKVANSRENWSIVINYVSFLETI